MRKLLLAGLLFFGVQVVLCQEKIEFIDVDKILSEVANSAEQNDFKSILSRLETIPKNDSVYCNSLITKSYYLLQDEQFEQLPKVYDEALKWNCSDELNTIKLNISVGYLRNEEYDKAIAISDSILKQKPFYTDAMKNKALALMKAERFEESIQAYKDVIRIYPYDSQPHLQLGILSYNAGLSAQALMCFNMYMLLNDDIGNSLNVLQSLDKLTFNTIKKGEKKDYQVSQYDQEFKDIDQILDQRVALQDSYETGMEIDIPFVKQSHALFSYLKDVKKEGGLWFEIYAPVFEKIMNDGHFNEYMFYITQALADGKYKSLYRRNSDEAVEVATESIIHLVEKMSEYDFGTGENYYYQNGLLSWIGKSEDGEPVGIYRAFDSEGRMSEKGYFNKDHKKEGEWKIFYEDGTTKEVINFENDLREGISHGYHPNGVKSYEITWEKDVANGSYRNFTESGALKIDKTLENSENEGGYKSYFDIGKAQIEFDGFYSKNELNGKLIEYHVNGKVYQESTYKDHTIVGEQKTFNSQGVLISVYNFSDGLLNGAYKTFHGNGQKNQIATMKNGEFDGEYLSHHNNGNIYIKASYNSKGELDGLYQEYTRDGTLWYEYDYVNSKITKYRFYDYKGEILHEDRKRSGNLDYKGYTTDGILFIEGLFDIRDGKAGVWRYYSETTGELESKEIFVDNLLDGKYTKYFPDGSLKEMTEYTAGKLGGYSAIYYPNGNIKSQGYHEDGAAQGKWERYYVDGVLQERSYYHNGTIIKEQYVYGVDGKKRKTLFNDATGKLKRETFFKNDGSVNQVFEYPFSNGQLDSEVINDQGSVTEVFPYLNGVIHGSFKRFSENRNVIAEGDFLNGNTHGSWIYYYIDGKIRTQLMYDTGTRHGKAIGYHENGQLESEYENEYGLTQGPYIEYWPNGNVHTRMNFIDDKKHGERKQYDPDGNLQLVRYYDYGKFLGYSHEDKNGELIEMIPIEKETGKIKAFYKNGNVSREYTMDNGELIGVYKTYYATGSPLSITSYKYGMVHGKTKTYHPNKNLKSEVDYVLDQKHGTEIIYHENGKLKRRTSYLNDLKHGTEETYDSNGKLISTEEYLNDNLQF
ncbi:MAG: hypothetical protein WBG46_06765 [Nonlabens sp.]